MTVGLFFTRINLFTRTQQFNYAPIINFKLFDLFFQILNLFILFDHVKRQFLYFLK